MRSFRAAALKYGSSPPISARALAAKFGMAAPVSVVDLTHRLNQTFRFRVDSFHVLFQRAATGHSDDDFLSLVVAIDDQVFTLPADRSLMGRTLHTGDILTFGDRFTLGPFTATPTSKVSVALAVLNLGDGDPSPGDQVEAAGRVTDQIAAALTPFAATAGGVPELVVAVAGAIGAAMQLLGNLFSGPHCNGVVLKDGLHYTGQDLADLTASGPRTITRRYATETSPASCGHAPESDLTFTIL
jgi:hypothetical protein